MCVTSLIEVLLFKKLFDTLKVPILSTIDYLNVKILPTTSFKYLHINPLQNECMF